MSDLPTLIRALGLAPVAGSAGEVWVTRVGPFRCTLALAERWPVRLERQGLEVAFEAITDERVAALGTFEAVGAWFVAGRLSEADRAILEHSPLPGAALTGSRMQWRTPPSIEALNQAVDLLQALAPTTSAEAWAASLSLAESRCPAWSHPLIASRVDDHPHALFRLAALAPWPDWQRDVVAAVANTQDPSRVLPFFALPEGDPIRADVLHALLDWPMRDRAALCSIGEVFERARTWWLNAMGLQAELQASDRARVERIGQALSPRGARSPELLAQIIDSLLRQDEDELAGTLLRMSLEHEPDYATILRTLVPRHAADVRVAWVMEEATQDADWDVLSTALDLVRTRAAPELWLSTFLARAAAIQEALSPERALSLTRLLRAQLGDHFLCARWLRLVGARGDATCEPELIAWLLASAHPRIQAACLEALGSLGGKAALEHVTHHDSFFNETGVRAAARSARQKIEARLAFGTGKLTLANRGGDLSES